MLGSIQIPKDLTEHIQMRDPEEKRGLNELE